MRASLSANITSVQRATARYIHTTSLGVVVLFALSGCTSCGYYLQAAGGQFEIWQRQQSIDRLLAQHDLPAALRSKLELVVKARQFAASQLALPDHGSYHSYADIGRDYVVWNVIAAPELSLTAHPSCYPMLGCLDYRGFFKQANARLYATTLQARGFDTFVGGVAAYSTLGWLHDPLLSSVLRWDSQRVVDTVFHELAHQRLYIAGDTTFNESFASAVAHAGMALWLGPQSPPYQRYVREQARETAFIALLRDYRERLAATFAAPLPASHKRAEKARLYGALRSAYGELKARWGGANAYDQWMDNDLNNAKLVSLAAYHDDIAAFNGVLTRCARDFAQFYRVVARLGALAVPARRRCLAQLGAAGQVEPACLTLLH